MNGMHLSSHSEPSLKKEWPYWALAKERFSAESWLLEKGLKWYIQSASSISYIQTRSSWVWSLDFGIQIRFKKPKWIYLHLSTKLARIKGSQLRRSSDGIEAKMQGCQHRIMEHKSVKQKGARKWLQLWFFLRILVPMAATGLFWVLTRVTKSPCTSPNLPTLLTLVLPLLIWELIKVNDVLSNHQVVNTLVSTRLHDRINPKLQSLFGATRGRHFPAVFGIENDENDTFSRNKPEVPWQNTSRSCASQTKNSGTTPSIGFTKLAKGEARCF